MVDTAPAIVEYEVAEPVGVLRAVLGAAIRAVETAPHAARELDDDASQAKTLVMDPETVVDAQQPGHPREIDFRGVTLRLF